MTAVWRIARKELAHTFNSTLAYLIALVFVIALPVPIFWSASAANIFLSGQTDLRPLFGLLPIFLMVFTPALAMRAWGEEYHLGAIETLMTLPIKDGSLTLGKFLGVFILAGACLLATAPIPILVSKLGDLDWGPVIGGYCGALLLAAACCSAALTASAFARNQSTAFVLSLLTLAALMFVDILAINFHARFTNLARGVIDTRDVVFYLSATALFLFLNAMIVKGRRLGRSAKYAPARILEFTIATALVITVHFLSARHFARFDLTDDRLFTLNRASHELIDQLEEPLHFKMFFSEELPDRFRPVFEFIKSLVAEYEAYGGDMIRVSYTDPGARLELVDEAHKLGVFETKANVLDKDRMELAYIWFGLTLLYRDGKEVFPSVASVENFEYDVSSAIARLLRDRTPRLALVGPDYAEDGGVVFDLKRNMKPVLDELGSMCEVTHYKIEPEADLDLTNADAVIAWGLPRFSENQLYALDQFIMSGRSATLLAGGVRVDPIRLEAKPLPDSRADQFLAHFGARVNRDLIADWTNTKIKYTDVKPPTLKDYPLFPALTPKGGGLDRSFPPTAALNSLIAPWPSSLELAPPPGVAAKVIARSSNQAWRQSPPFEIDPELLPGPRSFEQYPLAATLTGRFITFFPTPPPGADPQRHLSACAAETTLQVWTSEHYLTQAHNPPIRAWLAATAEYASLGHQLAGIDRRENAFRPVRNLTSGQKATYRWLSVIIAPALILIFAIARYGRRRYRKVGDLLG